MMKTESLTMRLIHAAALDAYPEFVVDKQIRIHDGYMELAMVSLSSSEVLKLCIGLFELHSLYNIILYLHPVLPGTANMPIFNRLLIDETVKNVTLISLDPSDPGFIDKILKRIWKYIRLNCCITEY